MKPNEKVINVQPGQFGDQCHLFGLNLPELVEDTLQPSGQPQGECPYKPEFLIFGDDGRPKSSRLEGVVCADHLAFAVRAIKLRQADGERTQPGNSSAAEWEDWLKSVTPVRGPALEAELRVSEEEEV